MTLDNERLRLLIQLLGLAISILTIVLAFLKTLDVSTVAAVLSGQSIQQISGLYAVPLKAKV